VKQSAPLDYKYKCLYSQIVLHSITNTRVYIRRSCSTRLQIHVFIFADRAPLDAQVPAADQRDRSGSVQDGRPEDAADALLPRDTVHHCHRLPEHRRKLA